MYRSRLTIFAMIATAIILSLPIANLGLRAYIGGKLWPTLTRDLWSLDRVEGNVAYLLMSCCNRSMYPARTRIGQNGYFFLGDDDGQVISKATGIWQPPEGLVEDRAAGLARLQQSVADAGAALAVVIAPNKHSIYPEMLPPDLSPAPQTVTDDLVNRAEAMGVPILDLRPVMRRLKGASQAYLKTDTHWTNAGAAASYDHIMRFLRDQQAVQVSPVDYHLTPARRGAGDLAGLLKMQEMFGPDHETDYRIIITPPPETCLATISLLSGKTSACVAIGDDEVSVMDRSMKLTRTDNAPNGQTLLMLCDSFCTASSALFDASFKTVYRVHWKFIDSAALGRYLRTLSPDIVVVQFVERDMLSFTAVGD